MNEKSKIFIFMLLESVFHNLFTVIVKDNIIGRKNNNY